MARPQGRAPQARMARLGICALAIALAVVLGRLCFLYAFRPAPEVSVRADNRYEETLRAVMDDDCAPYSYVDERGVYSGLAVELINEIANRMEVNLDLQLVGRAEAERRIRASEADLILDMEPERTAGGGLIATLPIAEVQYAVFGRERVDSVIDLYGRRTGSIYPFAQLGLGDGIVLCESYGEIFERLKAGQLDFAICPIRVGDALQTQLFIRDVRSSFAVGQIYGTLAVPAERTELRARLNDVLKALGDEGYLAKLDAKWVRRSHGHSDAVSVIASHPVYALVLLMSLLALVVLSLLVIAAQRRSAAEKASYTRQLQENLEIIRAARVKAYMDDLTGIRNKNAYREMEEEIQLRIDAGAQPPFAIVVCDLNGLKDVNDANGHQAGDVYLKDACRLICRVYAHSPVFRIGGDEFAVVLSGEDYENRDKLLMQIRHFVLANQMSGGVIVATGMSEFDGGAPIREVFERADRKMYENKATLKGARL